MLYKIEQVDAVGDVLWYDTAADITIPKELLPDDIYDVFNNEDSTMMAVFFNKSTSADESLDAVAEIRKIYLYQSLGCPQSQSRAYTCTAYNN